MIPDTARTRPEDKELSVSDRSRNRFAGLGILLPIVGCQVNIARADSSITQVKDSVLARVVAFGQVLLESGGIRVVEVPVAIDDCWGTVSSCPDIELYIAYSTGDLRDEPVVYRLPPAKGWKIVRGQDPQSIDIATTLPDANIDSSERSRWSPTVYRVTIGAAGVTRSPPG